jgi:hypothetical protein
MRLSGSFRNPLRRERQMDFITRILVKLRIFKEDFDYHLIRACMVTVFLFFGYQNMV